MTDKYWYIKAIWYVFAGLCAIMICFRFCADLPRSKDEFPVLKGKITDIRRGRLFLNRLNSTQNSVIVCVDSVASAYVFQYKHVAILDTVMNVGDSCQIWVDTEVCEDIETGEEYRYIMKAMSIDGEQIFDYKIQRGFVISIWLYALIIFIPALLVVVKHPKMLSGKKKE
jgi:hypothetical protein